MVVRSVTVGDIHVRWDAVCGVASRVTQSIAAYRISHEETALCL